MTPVFRDYLCAPHKLAYVEGKERRMVPCIFCAIVKGDPRIPSRIILRTERLMVMLNLYPYNPGHLMVVPVRHVEKLQELSREELNEFFWMGVKAVRLLEEALHPAGVNMGLNLGAAAGASIDHLHLHVVPRFPRELGFMETTAGTRTLIMDLDTVYKRLSQHLHILQDSEESQTKEPKPRREEKHTSRKGRKRKT